MKTANEYGTLRVKLATIEDLKVMKEAFEASYEKKFTVDEFLRQLSSAVEDGDPGVWEIYCTLMTQKEELKEKILASQKLRKEQDK